MFRMHIIGTSVPFIIHTGLITLSVVTLLAVLCPFLTIIYGYTLGRNIHYLLFSKTYWPLTCAVKSSALAPNFYTLYS